MKGIIRKLIVLTLAFSALMAFSAFAAGWTLDGAVQTMAVAAGYAGTRAVSTEGKTLVVYFSATGNTERVAEMIAETTGGDLFELEPADPYTDEDLNYNDENSRVSQEYADESLRNVELVAATMEGFDEYENVFVGYPKMEQGFLSV